MIEVDEFVTIAENLSQSGETCEATRRTVIGRAYYGSYHMCKKLCDELDCWHVRHGSEHEKLINSLSASEDSALRKQGHRLREMKAKRITADYYLSQNVSISDMKQLLRRSKAICADSQQCLQKWESNG